MDDVRAAEGSSGLVVATTFAGAGGSSLGYRLAGFRVAYANEWDAKARHVYELNTSAWTRVDSRDIRAVTALDIVDGCGCVPDVLDGSPPCQDWSMMGNRDLAGVRATLYGEFVRLVGELRPRAFVAENVTGLVMGDAKPRFAALLAQLRAHGYDVAVRVLDASRLGVPQERKRVVVIGFRGDTGLRAADAFPVPGPVSTITGALPLVAALAVEESGRPARRYIYLHEHRWPGTGPCPTITTRGPGPLSWHYVRAELADGSLRRVTADEVRALCGFPRGFDLGSSAFATAAHVFGNAVPPPMARAWAAGVRDLLLG